MCVFVPICIRICTQVLLRIHLHICICTWLLYMRMLMYRLLLTCEDRQLSPCRHWRSKPAGCRSSECRPRFVLLPACLGQQNATILVNDRCFLAEGDSDWLAGLQVSSVRLGTKSRKLSRACSRLDQCCWCVLSMYQMYHVTPARIHSCSESDSSLCEDTAAVSAN